MLQKPPMLQEPDKSNTLELGRKAPFFLNVFPAPSSDKAKVVLPAKTMLHRPISIFTEQVKRMNLE